MDKDTPPQNTPPSPNLSSSLLHRIHQPSKKAASSSKSLQIAAKKSLLVDSLDHQLLEASASGNTSLVESLLLQGAHVNSQDEKKRSALHFSCVGNHGSVTSLLLQHKADVSIKDRVGNTPLHLAVISGHLENVLLLLKAGADPSIQDVFKRSPLDLVKSRLRILSNQPTEYSANSLQLLHELKQLLEILNYYSSHLHKLDLQELTSRLEGLVSKDDTKGWIHDLSQALDELQFS